MTRDYIARDPRTGKPLNVGRSKSKKLVILQREVIDDIGKFDGTLRGIISELEKNDSYKS